MYIIRNLRKNETDLLKDFLYEAIFIPEGVETPERSIIEKPELRVYTDDFGSRKGDNCLVADYAGKVVGAVRMYKNVGFKIVDENDEEYIMVCELKEW